MSLDETRATRIRPEVNSTVSPYSLISKTLAMDGSELYYFFQRAVAGGNGESFIDPLGVYLASTYGIRLTDVPTLSRKNSLIFDTGFHYIAHHLYLLIENAFSSRPLPEKIADIDHLLDLNFPGKGMTTGQLLAALAVDPSGATWLEEMARDEFKEDNLKLAGALKAIAGARKMYEELVLSHKA